MPERKNKTFQYRYVEGLHQGRTLYQILTQTLYTELKTVGQRSELVSSDDPNEEVRQCLNHKARDANALFVEMILYVKGKNKEAVTVNEDLEELPTVQIRAPKTPEGETREFIEGAVYFVVIDNHMVLVQSTGLRDRDLESHLNWLLADQAKKLQDGEVVVMKRELSASAKAKMKRVRSVEIGAPLMRPEQVPVPEGQTETKEISTRYVLTDIGKEVLDALFSSRGLSDLGMEQLQGADNLEVTIKILRKRGPSKPGNDAEKAMTALTTHLRHSHVDDIIVRTKGGKIKGDILYLMETKSVECVNGVPVKNKLFDSMREWLIEKIEDESIPV